MNSLLFVPSIPKMMAKIPGLEADAYIIDLEDSIREEDKEKALEDACGFLSNLPDVTIFVRIAGNHIKDELEKLDKYPFSGYMIPKFEAPERYEKYSRYFEGRNNIALVETPAGIANVKEIAGSPLIKMVAFGAEDYTASINAKNAPMVLNYARSAIVTFGKAYGKKVFDTPSFILDDMVALNSEIQIAVDMGFDGKLAIHPKQVAPIRQLFSQFDLDRLKEVVERYEEAGEAVLRIGDNVYEKMHIARFKRILKEHEVL